MTQQQLPLDLRLRDSSRLDTFYPGDNTLAVAAIRAIARPAAAGLERQVYLHGAPGSGKSHLLQAACHESFAHGMRCAYLPLAELAVRDAGAVVEGLERLDLVVIDDLQSVAGRNDWEQALFGLINRTRERAGRLLLAARETPQALDYRLPDLVSRLTWGPVFRLEQPGEVEIKAILQQRAALRGLELGAAAADYLLRHEYRDLDTLLRLLDRLDLAALAEQRRLTVPFIRAQARQMGASGPD